MKMPASPSRTRRTHPAPRKTRPKCGRQCRTITAQRPVRDWLILTISALPGLAAVVALIFTSLSIRATNDQLRLAEQGQIIDRYNAAISNLASPSTETRLGGIYALQSLMQDAPHDQPTIVAVLAAYVRDHAKLTKPPLNPLVTDTQAALTVIGTRDTANDSPQDPIDLDQAQLAEAQLSFGHFAHANLDSADLADADLRHANLTHADLAATDLHGAQLWKSTLTGADLSEANLSYAILAGADLTHANLLGANLTGASLTHAEISGNLSDAILIDTNLTGADLTGADLRAARLGSADLIGAKLAGADLRWAMPRWATLSHAYLRNANLTDADLTHAHLIDADLADANLSHADLTGANLTGANLTGANLTYANLAGADLKGVKGLDAHQKADQSG